MKPDDVRLKNLRPVKKGECRNPGGKSKGTLHKKTILRQISDEDTPEIILKKLHKMGVPPKAKTVEMCIQWVMSLNALKGDMQAIKEYNNRIYGKSKEHITIAGDQENPVNFNIVPELISGTKNKSNSRTDAETEKSG